MPVPNNRWYIANNVEKFGGEVDDDTEKENQKTGYFSFMPALDYGIMPGCNAVTSDCPGSG